MSCDKRCYDKDDKYYGHEICGTCPGRDDGSTIPVWHDIINENYRSQLNLGAMKIMNENNCLVCGCKVRIEGVETKHFVIIAEEKIGKLREIYGRFQHMDKAITLAGQNNFKENMLYTFWAAIKEAVGEGE